MLRSGKELKVFAVHDKDLVKFCTEAKKKIGNAVKFAGGPDIGNASGFENGGANNAVTNSVDACINASDGYFVFDMVHVRQFNYWNSLKQGIEKYLNTLR